MSIMGSRSGFLTLSILLRISTLAAATGRDQFERKPIALTERLRSIDHQRKHINLAHRVAYRLHHQAVHAVNRLVNSGSVHEHKLSFGSRDDAANNISRCLGFVGHDGDLFSDELIERAWICRNSDGQ